MICKVQHNCHLLHLACIPYENQCVQHVHNSPPEKSGTHLLGNTLLPGTIQSNILKLAVYSIFFKYLVVGCSHLGCSPAHLVETANQPC